MIYLQREQNRIYFYGDEIQRVLSLLRVKKPGAEYSPHFQSGIWDGKKPFYKKTNNQYYFDLGLFWHVKNLLISNEIEFDFSKVYFDKIEEKYIKYDSSLWEHQVAALKNFYKNPYGILKITTRGGKTRTSMEAVKTVLNQSMKSRCLFLVDSSDLYVQTKEQYAEFFGEKIVGGIKGSDFSPNQITIATIQTLSRKIEKNNKNTIDYLKEVDFLIVDEVHEFTSDKRISVINKCYNIKYMMALSATPFKNEKIHEISVKSFSGEILYESDEKVLIEKNVLAENKTIMIECKQEFKGSKVYNDIVAKFIINSEKRNSLVCNLVDVCRELNLKTIVFFHLEEHGKILSEKLGIPYIFGKTDDDLRLQHKKDLLSGDGGVLLVSSIWKKGITLPEVAVMINAAGGKESTLLEQKRGRTLGRVDKKSKAITIDIYDKLEPKSMYNIPDSLKPNYYLTEHSRHRYNAFKKMNGEDKVTIIPNYDEELFKQELQEWFGVEPFLRKGGFP